MLSAGTKRLANRAWQALKMAAMNLSQSDSALGAFYRRLCYRMEEQQRERSIAALKRRPAALGLRINPLEAAA